jgi:hypothetical protein
VTSRSLTNSERFADAVQEVSAAHGEVTLVVNREQIVYLPMVKR